MCEAKSPLALGMILAATTAPLGCNQDSYASTPERDTHMGETRAAPDPFEADRLEGGAVAATSASSLLPRAVAGVQPLGSGTVGPGGAPAPPAGGPKGASAVGPSAVPAVSTKATRARPAAPAPPTAKTTP